MTDDLQRARPVVLILGEAFPAERSQMEEWFRGNSFRVCNSDDIFEAAEEMADFTQRSRPEVVMWNVECGRQNIDLARALFAPYVSESDLSIIALSERPSVDSSSGCFEGNAAAIASRLETLFPERTMSH